MRPTKSFFKFSVNVLLVFLLVSSSFSKDKVNLQARFQEALSMPEGMERTTELESLLVADRKEKLGAALIDEIVRIYLAEGDLNRVLELEEEMKDRKSRDYDSKIAIGIMLHEERNEKKNALRWLEMALKNVGDARRKSPAGYYSPAWLEETNRLAAEIQANMALVHYDNGDYESSKDYITRAMNGRTEPEDYHFFSEILLHQGLFRQCIGAAMFAYQRGNMKDALETLKSAYDSLAWDITLYERYVDEFRDLYIDNTVKDILKKKELAKAKDLEEFQITTLVDANGAILIFWDENMHEYDFRALEDTYKILQRENIPNSIQYVGHNFEETSDKLRKKRYTFWNENIATVDVQEVYKVEKTPTIVFVGDNLRLLYRIEGPNRNMGEIFTQIWESHLESRAQHESSIR